MGHKETDRIGKNLSQLFPEEYRPVIDEAVKKVLAGEQNYFEAVQLFQDGSRVIWSSVLSPISDKTGKVIRFIGIFTDITERKKLESEILKTQKLESLGILAGGIAHDFNNLLVGVFGYISLAKLKGDRSIISYLEGAEKALEQARGLTQQLLTFSRGGEPVKKTLNIAPLIGDAVRFATSGSNVDVELSLPEDLKATEADAGQLTQVIQNIVINAVEAMPTGGTITVEAWNETLTKDTPLSKAEDYIAIAIKDQGIGIPREYLTRVFDPFFTTKKKGNGLGLASSYAIITKHGGLLRVCSEVGKGSTFTIFLPASDKVFMDKRAEDMRVVYGKGRILVLEDEEIVTLVCRDMLTTLGYEVQFVTTGKKVLKEYIDAMESGRPYDAVILDLTIKGGMGGEETIKGLLALNPQVKAVVSSGYSEDSIMSDYSSHGFKAILAKPYRMEEISKVLHELINPYAIIKHTRVAADG